MGLTDLDKVKDRKRRYSASDNSSDDEQLKKKKNKGKKYYSESDSDSCNNRVIRKSKKHNKKEHEDVIRNKTRKNDGNKKSSKDNSDNYYSETIDLDKETQSKRKKGDRNWKMDSDSEKEMKRDKRNKRDREDKKRPHDKSFVDNESSKSKHEKHSKEGEKYKKTALKEKMFKDYKEDHFGRKNKHDSGNESGGKNKSDNHKKQRKFDREGYKESYDDKAKDSVPSRKKKKSNKDDYEESHNWKHPYENNPRDKKQNDDDILNERNDEESELSFGDYNDRTSSSEKPFRYRSISRGPIRKNSDSYWNKYSERLKEPEESLQEPMEVGPRYYSSGNTLKNENPNKDDKQKQDIDQKNEPKTETPPKPKKSFDALTSRTGGAYIPPAKLRMMQESITDKASAAYQRLAWEALKKSIQGHVNKVNTSNITIILKDVVKENIVRGRGLLCRALIQAQAASPSFTNVYAAFTSALNSKFPMIGELLLKRLITQFRRGFKRNDKTICITAVTFIAHLVNQGMVHEIIALEILTLLLDTPTEDSVEVAIAFLKECGAKLTELANKALMGIFDMLRNILHEGKLEQRVQYMIEVIFQIRKEDFKAHPSVVEELDIVDEDSVILHTITLEEPHDPQEILNVFKLDPDYEANELKYKSLVQESDEESGDEEGSGSEDSEDESEEEGEQGEQKNGVIVDRTETNLTALRKTIYLTIQSSLDFQECAHKLLRMELKPGQEIEMAHMFLDCCSEQRTYEKFFGLLAQRFCQINHSYIAPFEETFRDSYATIHRMSNDKLRNVGKLFAHLLFTDAISWEVLSTIRLNEDDTTSSSRIFIKVLFLELSEYMGLAKLNQRVKDPSLQTALEGLFPRDNPKHTRFAINFFTSIGLGGLTDELREHLKAQPKPTVAVPQLVEGLSSSSSSSDSSDSSSESSSSDSSSSDSSSSDSEDQKTRKKKTPIRKKKNLSVKKGDKKKNSNKTVRKDLSSNKKKKSSPDRRKRDR